MESLTECVFDLLVEGEHPDDTVDLVLAALEGDAALTAALAGTAPARPDPGVPRSAPAGAFLTGITVQGFRGIGPETQLTLTPGPGLTVISGRNGSGKSSLAEALECALTGTTARWERKLGGTDFRSGWRNLHQPDPCRIRVSLHQEDKGPAAITVTWAKDCTDSGVASFAYQAGNEKQQKNADVLGWQTALQTYRPLLSYDDLGQLVTAKPSELHDSIARALALDELHAAIALLRDRIGPLTRPARQASDDRKQLRNGLADLEDSRAQQARRLLAKAEPDNDALQTLQALASSSASNPVQEVQLSIRAVQLPDADDVNAAADELDAATELLGQFGEQRNALEQVRDRLLADAVAWHAESGDGDCPVCGSGRLDETWRRSVTEALSQGQAARQAHADAHRRRQAARQVAARILGPLPAVATQTTLALSTQPDLVQRWTEWATPPDEGSWSQHLRDRYPAVTAALLAWQDEATAVAAEADEHWSPWARRLDRWTEQYVDARELQQQARALELAHKAAVEAEKQLRDQRLQPIVDRTIGIWEKLRQESNVSLQTVALTGAANRRAVQIQTAVDDVEGHALAVMSQGELNSLALALYLPRATSDESPFRFLVLDDPVQAMDPTKVEGLAAVLADLARERQVIVFSHDDRLAQAARRLPVAPTLLEVRRSGQSRVIVQSVDRATDRYLRDALALLKDGGVPVDVKRRVLPGVLRQAVEAAAWERYCSDRLRAGERIDAVEAAWSAVDRTRARVELAVGAAAAAWLGKESYRGRALQVCNAGTHQPTGANLDEALADASALTRAIERRLP